MISDFTQISQITGVGVAALAVFLMWKLTVTHLGRVVVAITQLTEVIRSLEEFLREHSYRKNR